MLNIVKNEDRMGGTYYVELIDMRLGRDDKPPGERSLRIGYWCDKGHLETIKAAVDGALGLFHEHRWVPRMMNQSSPCRIRWECECGDMRSTTIWGENARV